MLYIEVRIRRVATISGKPGNLKKLGKSKMVREMSGKMQKRWGKSRAIFLSVTLCSRPNAQTE